MNAATPEPRTPGVTLGYLAAGAIAAALWVGIGIVLIPLMVVMAIPHGLASSSGRPAVDSHHRWLCLHHLLSAAALVVVLVAPLLALPTLMHSATTILNTLAYAPHPIETLAAAWPQLGVGTLAAATFIALAGWLLVTLWISVRLIRRWLRWMDGRAA